MAKRRSKRTSSARKTRGALSLAPRNKAGFRHTPPPIEVIARGCLVEESRVLLCRNLKHGYLFLPGGHVEFGESAAVAVAREFLEESGLVVRVRELALASEGVFTTKKHLHHEVNLVFLVERPGAASKPGRPSGVKSREAHIAFEWIELSAVVDFDIRPTAAKAWLATLVGTDRNPIEWVSEIPKA